MKSSTAALADRLWNTITVSWRNLIEPHESITNDTRYHQSKLLNSILIVLFAMLIVVISIGSLNDAMAGRRLSQFAELLFLTPFLVVIGVLFWLNQRGGYLTSARGLVCSSLVLNLLYGLEDFTVLIYTVPLSLVTATLLSQTETRRYFLAAFLSIAVIVLMTEKRVTQSTLLLPLNFALLSFPIVYTYLTHRRFIEAHSRRVLERTNERLRDSELELEAHVQKRTDELESARHEIEQLYIEQLEVAKCLREIDQLKSQFLASMSHELRTPMNSILTFTELMAMGMFGEVNAEQKDYLGKSLQSGRHLLSLINDVLDITKIQSGMLKLFIEPDFDIARELEYLAATAEKQLIGKPVRFSLEVDAHLPLLTCDKRRMRQILMNLISNAIKFTDQGTITLRAIVKPEAILFSVIDTGPGIPQAMHELIFEPFVQTDTGIRHVGGTGLGLPICKQLVHAHQGQLSVESEPGKGAAFHVVIPLTLSLPAAVKLPLNHPSHVSSHEVS